MRKSHTTTGGFSALVSILLALAIGSTPVVAALTIQASVMEALA